MRSYVAYVRGLLTEEGLRVERGVMVVAKVQEHKTRVAQSRNPEVRNKFRQKTGLTRLTREKHARSGVSLAIERNK